ncbi:hypothetical protein U0070_011204 [Myodes glareolus]|uniref:Uncharacterized protein n=1 Tax=Myodes glareolus TaxID=447135 RepID=A0AAW0H7Q7_MYOGA
MGSKKQSAQSLQRPVTYEDVAVDFTNEEWACLTEKQKILYRKVQSETFKNLTFVDQYAMQKERRQKRSGLCPTKAIGSKKRNSQGPSSNLEDEESNDKEKASLVCTGMFKGGPLYFCLTCGKCYKKYINLFNHQFKAQKTTRHKVRAAKPQHRRERTFSCQLCNKNYRDPSGLSRHRRTHLGYRPSSCSVCGKRFRDQSEVKRHMKVHENRKPVTGNQEHEVKKVPLTTAGSQGPNLRHVKSAQPLQRPVTYEDVAVDFTNEEWACLTEKQKILYRKVQSETFKNLTFVGSKKRNSQGPSSNLEDEEKGSLACTGIF